MNKLKFFSLSTCIWCRKTRAHLDENKIAYQEITVDKLAGKEREAAINELAKYNASKSFPTLVFSDDNVVVGFKPDQIREALKK